MHNNTPKKSYKRESNENRESLVFICIDCLRDDVLHRGSAKIPFLTHLTQHSTYYTNMYSTATTTTPSIASIFTGTYPYKNGIYSLLDTNLAPHLPTLAEKFHDAGFDTHALMAGPLLKKTGLARGFAHYQYREPQETILTDWFSTLQAYLTHLLEQSQPFFLYLHIWALHKPYHHLQQFRHRKYGVTPYEQTLSAIDTKLQAIAEQLPQHVSLAICSDHGEGILGSEFPLYKALYFLINSVRTAVQFDIRTVLSYIDKAYTRINDRLRDHFTIHNHGDHIYDFLTNVPFFLHDPGIPNRIITQQVRHVDIYPTLLDRFTIPYTSSTIDGQSMLPLHTIHDRLAYLRACGASLKEKTNWIEGMRTPTWKLATYPYKKWSPELYNLEHDPFELHNIAHQKKSIVQKLTHKLEQIRQHGQTTQTTELRRRIKKIQQHIKHSPE